MKQFQNHPMIAIMGIVASLISIYIFVTGVTSIRPALSDFAATIAGTLLGALIAFVFASFYYKKPSAKVFISYSNKDVEFTDKLANDLNNSGFQVLKLDNIVLVGDNIKDKVSEAIRNADFFVSVISKDSIESQWIPYELELAQKNNKKIFPFLKEKIDSPLPIADIQYADFSANYETAITALIKSLHANMQESKSFSA